MRIRSFRSLGARGERAAERSLRRLGWTILGRRVRLPHGELDLIAVEDGTIVFVEVKTRRGDERGRPEEAVDAAKQRKLTSLAAAYLRRHDLLEQPARFDVISVEWATESRPPRLTHYRNAFEARAADDKYG